MSTSDDELPLSDTARLLASLPSRIDEIATRRAAAAADDDALRERGRVWSNRALGETLAQCAQRLTQAGVRAGDRVLIVGENCAALVALLFATSSLGAWSVIVNARLAPREIDAIRDHCNPRVALYLADLSVEARAHAMRHHASTPLAIGSMGEALLGPTNEACEPERASADPATRVAALVYTSGTTGEPKGVMLTHRNLLYIARVSSALRRLDRSDRVYGVLPISHVYGLASVCLGTLYAGACLSLEARYSSQAMRDALTRGGITVAQGVPTMYAKLVELVAASRARFDAPQLRFLYTGGAPLDAALKADVERTLGRTLHNGYGLTEASPTVTQTRLASPRGDCSVGLALPGVEIRIVDASGRDVAEGAPGELLVRGPNVMLGYYKDPAGTARAVSADGWLSTGDLVRRDPDGALFVLGRSKELIIRSGFNVHPPEVEGVLNAHPAVLHSAVVGRAVAGNEEVVAFVELAPGSTTSTDEIARFAADRLAPYKRPAEIVVLPSLPTTSAGKVRKHELRALAQQRARSEARYDQPIETNGGHA